MPKIKVLKSRLAKSNSNSQKKLANKSKVKVATSVRSNKYGR